MPYACFWEMQGKLIRKGQESSPRSLEGKTCDYTALLVQK